MILCRDGKPAFSMAEREHTFLMRIKEKITKEDSDVLGIYSGNTGSGKSVKAMHAAYVIDPTIELSRICFTKDEFTKAIIHSKKGQVVIGDEAVSLFFSRAAMAKENRLVVEMMAQIRQKNLAVFLCVPEPLMLDWTILKKAHFHSQIWEGRQNDVTLKGNQAIFIDLNAYKAKTLFYEYLRHKKNNIMAKIKRPSWNIRTEGSPVTSKPWYPVNEQEYRKKKESILEKFMVDETDPEKSVGVMGKKWQDQRDRLIIRLYDLQNPKNITKLSEEVSLPRTTVQDIIRKHRKMLDVPQIDADDGLNINKE